MNSMLVLSELHTFYRVTQGFYVLIKVCSPDIDKAATGHGIGLL